LATLQKVEEKPSGAEQLYRPDKNRGKVVI